METPRPGPVRVLIIDDDRELCELLVAYLDREGFVVACAHDGATGLRRASSEFFDVIILDVMLPAIPGFDLLRRLRKERDTPVVMLSARGEEVDRIVGLELGADDYLPKPFNPRELVARIHAVLRRYAGERDRGHDPRLHETREIGGSPEDRQRTGSSAFHGAERVAGSSGVHGVEQATGSSGIHGVEQAAGSSGVHGVEQAAGGSGAHRTVQAPGSSDVDRSASFGRATAPSGELRIEPPPAAISSGDLRVDLSRREAAWHNRPVPLTTVEFDVIAILIQATGRVVSREEISQKALGRSHSPYDRSVDMHVSNLRRKLQAVAGDRVMIKTVRSAGYLLVCD